MTAEPRRICVVTTSRADYGLLRRLMEEINLDQALQLQVVATGMHLVPELGQTISVIEADGLGPDRAVEMLLAADSDLGAAKSIGVGLLAFPDVLKQLDPQLVVVLGDRFELLAPAVAALMLRIPIAHIHGGETTEGALDEAIRHAVTKFSTLHFASTETYRKRIIQMGENPERVFNFGAPGLDNLYHLELFSREELEQRLEFALAGPVALVTYHPATLEPGLARERLDDLLEALESVAIKAVFTKANADEQGYAINRRLAEFCQRNPDRYRLYDSLGTQLYFSCMAHCDLMVGNSSSGLIEAPSFHLPVVNVGERQAGRVRAENVIDVASRRDDIKEGITRALSQQFRSTLTSVENPYDASKDGSASRRIKEVLKSVDLSAGALKKAFYDYPEVR
ncbi:MAG: UDP-N-acetylglucosamine 2-epimerase (hydrolyzing) [Spirochaetaceae bacterium]|nr:MAG: UDP-N-acetylglucosamine 2-epimerase (hydrolyzing) [Spirochaetaceae bacterium]